MGARVEGIEKAVAPSGPTPTTTPSSGVTVGWDVWGTDGARKTVFVECRQTVPAAAVAQAWAHAGMKYGTELGDLGCWRFEVQRSGQSGATVHRFRFDAQGQVVPL